MAPLAWARTLALWALLAAPVFAGPQKAAPVGVYAAPSAAWSAAVAAPVVNLSVPGLSLNGAALAADPRSLAPIVHELGRSLNITPQAFAKLPADQQQTVLAMAAEQAAHDLTQRSYELIGEAKALVWAKDGLGKQDLDDLYRVAAELREIDRHYPQFLGPDERQVVAMTAKQAAERWREARRSFIEQFGEAGAKALETGKEGEAGSVASAPAKRPKPLNPSTGARKLRERMQGTKSGWGEKDFETLYAGYGFTFREGSKHRMYAHPDFPQLHTTVSRQRDLPPGYAQEALKLIAELEALSAPRSIAQLQDDELPPPISAEAVKAAEKAQKQADKKQKPAPVVLAQVTLSPAASPEAGREKVSKPAAEAPKAKPAVELQGALPQPETPEPKKPGWSLREWLRRVGLRRD